MKVNEIIKMRRKDLGLTMKEVANAVGVSEATVSRWEMSQKAVTAFQNLCQTEPAPQ